jgi:hypothetical protein
MWREVIAGGAKRTRPQFGVEINLSANININSTRIQIFKLENSHVRIEDSTTRIALDRIICEWRRHIIDLF